MTRPLCRPAAVARVLALASVARPVITVAVDGPSGAGKTTFANALLQDWPGAQPVLVRMDELCPGWDGLDATISHATHNLTAPRSRGLPAAWRRWDWLADRWAEWHPVSATAPLILEGCGAFAAVDGLPALRVWARSGQARKSRALERDTAGDYQLHWDRWDRSWRRYLSRYRPERIADVLVSSPS